MISPTPKGQSIHYPICTPPKKSSKDVDGIQSFEELDSGIVVSPTSKRQLIEYPSYTPSKKPFEDDEDKIRPIDVDGGIITPSPSKRQLTSFPIFTLHTNTFEDGKDNARPFGESSPAETSSNFAPDSFNEAWRAGLKAVGLPQDIVENDNIDWLQLFFQTTTAAFRTKVEIQAFITQ